MSQSSIFILPSVLEGLLNALCEEVGEGLPVICFDTIAYKLIITNNTDGLVIPYNNIESLASELNNLMINENRQIDLGKKAYLKSRNWQTEKIVNEYN